jgi:hypothetical protein
MGNAGAKKVGSEVYTGAATVGRVGAAAGAIIATVFSILMIIGGIILLIHSGKYKRVTGSITSSDCTIETLSQGECNIQVSYSVKGKEYEGYIKSDTPYKKGDTLTIQYKVDDPHQIRHNRPLFFKPLGIGLIVAGVIICALSWLGFYLTMRYKAVGAVAGAADVFQAVGL